MISGLDDNDADGVANTPLAARETKEKPPMPDIHVENIVLDQNLTYEDAEHEPELHFKTWIALGAMWTYNFVIVLALNAPAAVTWIVTALTLPQCVLAPLLSSVSDVYQIRKPILVGAIAISFIGSAIAPGSQSIYRLIGAQVMISFGFSCAPLGYAIPSEILPRRWRPMGQVWVNTAAAIAACVGPLIIGAMTKADPINGWRKFWWIEMAAWGVTAIGIVIGYRPPKRHTRLDHLSMWQKLGHLDLPGFGLFAAGLSLFLVGLALGGGQYAWTNSRVLSTLISGLILLVCLGIYEWKGTSVGFLHHDLFRGENGMGRTFVIATWLLFAEGIMLFSYIVFFPLLNGVLFEQDPFLLVARQQPFWITALISTVFWGYTATRFRRVKEPLSVAFLILTGAIVGLATIQPDDELNALIFAGLAGIGFGGLIILIITVVQLSTPHHLIATATAVTVSARSVAGSIFTVAYVTAFSNRLEQKLPSYVAAAAAKAGLPATSLKSFVAALATHDQAALQQISGATPAIISAGLAALKSAYADSFRVVYIIAAPFGVAAAVSCWFMARMDGTLNYQVDAPMEKLKAKSNNRAANEAMA